MSRNHDNILMADLERDGNNTVGKLWDVKNDDEC
jgi:hypothetical protein